MIRWLVAIWRWIIPGTPPTDGMDGRAFSQQDRPIEDIEFAAIAISAVSPTQRHIGLLHRDSSSVLLLHLAWHHDLRNHSPGPNYIWISPRVPSRRLRHVAAKCRQVWRANPDGIPYAFSPPNDCFDANTGAYLLGPTGHGLTCASFVLAVFESVGLRLVDQETWPANRAGDEEWKQWVLLQLTQGNPPATPTASAHSWGI